MLQDGKRKLVTVRTIQDIRPIADADAVECAIVDGWQCVVKKGEFSIGQKVAYFEIDSLLPIERPEFSFLSGRGLATNVTGEVGHRLKTMKIRKTLSQGLILPLPEDKFVWNELDAYYGVIKYTIPEIAGLQGFTKGNFPEFIPKTDLERIQNMKEILENPSAYEVTEKYDGTSMTVYQFNGEFGVCSRNLEKMESKNCAYWYAVKSQNIADRLQGLGNFAIQGELMGPRIQGNARKLTAPQLFIFDVFSINTQNYLTPSERKCFLKDTGLYHYHIPIHRRDFTIKQGFESLFEEADKAAESPGVEGLVFKDELSQTRFKVISNKFLLKKEK